jgi:hypothetical protein
LGWSHPVAKLIGVYHYPIAILGEYFRYKRDPNQFYEAHSAAALSFDCERIRNDFVKLTQSVIAPELATSAETMVWRKGSILHVADLSVAGTEPLMTWKKQVLNVATMQHSREASHYGSLLQALFTSVAVYGKMREKSLASRRKEAVSLMHVGEPVRRTPGLVLQQIKPVHSSRKQFTLAGCSHFVSSLVAVGSSKHPAAKNQQKISVFLPSSRSMIAGLCR